jgi:hypothetical protein
VEGDANMLEAAKNTKEGVNKLTINAFKFLKQLSVSTPKEVEKTFSEMELSEMKMLYGGDANDIEDSRISTNKKVNYSTFGDDLPGKQEDYISTSSIYYGLKDYDYVYGNRDLNKVRLFQSMDMQYPDDTLEREIIEREERAATAQTEADEAKNQLDERVGQLGEQAANQNADAAQFFEQALNKAVEAANLKKDAEAKRKEFENTWWDNCKRGFAGTVDPFWPTSEQMSKCIGHFQTLENFKDQERKTLASFCRLSTIVNETMGAAENQSGALQCGVCNGLMKYFINRSAISESHTVKSLDWISKQPTVKRANQTFEEFTQKTTEWLAEITTGNEIYSIQLLKSVLDYVKDLMEPTPPDTYTLTLYDFLISEKANVAYVVSDLEGDFDVASVHASMQTKVGDFKLNALLAEVDVDKREWVKVSSPSSALDLMEWNRKLTIKIKESIRALNGQKTFNKDVAEKHAWVAALALGSTMGPVSHQLPFPVPFGKVNGESKQTVWNLGHIPNALPMVCHKNTIDKNSEVWEGTTRSKHCAIVSDQLPMVNNFDYAVRVDTQYKRPGWCFAITMHRMLADRVRHQLAQQLVRFLVYEGTSGQLDQDTIKTVQAQKAGDIKDPHALLDKLADGKSCNEKLTISALNEVWLMDKNTTIFVGPEVWIRTVKQIDGKDTFKYGRYRLLNAVKPIEPRGSETRIVIVPPSCLDFFSVQATRFADKFKGDIMGNNYDGNQASTMLCGMIGFMKKDFTDWENENWEQAHGSVVRVMPTNFYNNDDRSYEKMALFNPTGEFNFDVRKLEDNEMIGVPYVAFTHVDPLLGAKIKLEKNVFNNYNFQILKWS